jgi:hypothetical protein
MRASALAILLAIAATGAAGCGRIGYESIVDDGDGGIDAPVDAAGTFTPTPCDQAVMLVDLGAPATSPPARYALDVAVTDRGMVAVYQLGDGALYATGIAVDGEGGVENIQTRGHVVDSPTSDFSAAAIGNLVLLAVDDPGNFQIAFVDLSEFGYSNGDTSYHTVKHGRGHGFLLPDPDNDQFVVAGVNGTDTWRFTVDRDGDPAISPSMMITGGSVGPESVGVVRHGTGYAVFAGTTSECTVAAFDGSWAPLGAPRTVAMTCHNLGLAAAPASSNLVAAWNCDNDQVWATAGDPVAAAFPAEQSIFGGSGTVASNPRVAATPDGVWYAYAVQGGRLGRTLLDANGTPVSSVPAADVYSSPRVVAHDLVARDGKAFLLWIEAGAPADSLHVMRLCP